MTRAEKLAELRTFIANQILDGKDTDLEESTPLLEWGIINSISAAQLSTFVKERYGVQIPQTEMVAGNLESLGSFLNLLERLQPTANA